MSTDDDGFMEDDEYYDYEPSSPKKLRVAPEPFRVLRPADLDTLLESSISEFQEVVGPTSRDDALVVLNKFAWQTGQIEQAWFEDGGVGVRAKAGVPGSITEHITENCEICLSDSRRNRLGLESCLHLFCIDCYSTYLSGKIEDGQVCVMTSCPSFKCYTCIPQSMFARLVGPAQFEKQKMLQRQYFVASRNDVKWCPNPAGCDSAVQVITRDCPTSFITCGCKYRWCWQCLLESHPSVSCASAAKWNLKNSSESENVTWILANTKPCPKCHKPIEKNQGCNHMTCTRRSGGCGHEFCWMCLQSWASHSSSTGGFYSCNLYGSSKDAKLEEVEKIRQNSKTQLDRYMFFFARFMNHHKSALLADKALAESLPQTVEKIHEKLDLEFADLEFLFDALSQVIECRHVLKYTYVYGFYLGQEGSDHQGGVETKELFEYLQKNLEEFTDRLHEFVEKDLDLFAKDDEEESEAREVTDVGAMRLKFLEFRSQVANQCLVTKRFFHTILSDLANGN